MVHTSVGSVLGQERIPDASSINCEVVRNRAITHRSTFCTRIQAGYQVEELWRYSAEGHSVHRVECLTEVHIGFTQDAEKMKFSAEENDDDHEGC